MSGLALRDFILQVEYSILRKYYTSYQSPTPTRLYISPIILNPPLSRRLETQLQFLQPPLTIVDGGNYSVLSKYLPPLSPLSHRRQRQPSLSLSGVRVECEDNELRECTEGGGVELEERKADDVDYNDPDVEE